MEDFDISKLLKDWEYIPGTVAVRKIDGENNKQKIQLRIDLGIIQMETEGRPDGKTPYGFSSYLDYYESRLQQALDESENVKIFTINFHDAELLQTEAVQYYHRYFSLFHLGDFDEMIADTQHNLRILELINQYADNTVDIWTFQQHKPHVMMMDCRAKANISMIQDNFINAIGLINSTIIEIEKFYRDFGLDELIDTSKELGFLRGWINKINESKPPSKKEMLARKLKEAIETEEYELAAQIRDKMNHIAD